MMNCLLYLFPIILIQYTLAQILTVAGNNFIPNLYTPNVGGNIPIATGLATGLGLGNGIALANIGQTGSIEVANNVQRNPSNNLVNANLDNFYIPNGNANQGFVNNNALVGNIANANSNAANKFANIGLTNNVASNVANIGLANNVARNVGNIENPNANVPCNNANVPSISNYANIVKPPRDFGIEFGADALEVNGDVQVNGRMPFSANVALQGTMPAQGQGTVSYKCDKQSADDS